MLSTALQSLVDKLEADGSARTAAQGNTQAAKDAEAAAIAKAAAASDTRVQKETDETTADATYFQDVRDLIAGLTAELPVVAPVPAPPAAGGQAPA